MRIRTLREGGWIFAAILVAGAAALAFAPWLLPVPAAAAAFCLAFFRDPERTIPPAPDAVVSPADGLVTRVEEAEEESMPGGRCLRVSVFLSVFDVHVNRSPVAGEIVSVRHQPGNFFDARREDSASRNERQTWVIRSGGGTVVVRQITGAIARRIVAWAGVGDRVGKGERIGMIRFGSRTDLFLPPEAEVLVKPGDRVRGGSSVVARWNPGGAA
jgi:phosphatidylserine decarboxylase